MTHALEVYLLKIKDASWQEHAWNVPAVGGSNYGFTPDNMFTLQCRYSIMSTSEYCDHTVTSPLRTLLGKTW